MRRTVGLAVGGLVVALAAVAQAQSSQIKPRVMVMVDTSGSMTSHMIDGNDTGADQSLSYTDGVLTAVRTTPYGLYAGFATVNQCTATPTYDPNTSRMFNAKAAVTNVVNGSGDIDWGLMRYNGNYCAFNQALTPDNSALPNFNSDVWPNANPKPTGTQPAICTNAGATQCPAGQVCQTTTGRCLCTANGQCASNNCNTGTGECIVTAANQCASGTANLGTGQCLCTANAQCSSGSCNLATGQCTCTANGQCRSGSCNVATGWCNCSGDNQCLGSINGNNQTGSCNGGFCGCTSNASCISNTCNTYTERCGCSAASQCPSGTCTANSCTCNAGAQCRSGTCNASGQCACTNDWQCPANEFCISGICQRDRNLCNASQYGETATREGGTCRSQYTVPTTYAGGCGTNAG
ncbi:MAG: hypothetical protein JWN44_1704, partial [Myxococcales bacterium]|nr:hypothetical protein [Myxococcales bacterium]